VCRGINACVQRETYVKVHKCIYRGMYECVGACIHGYRHVCMCRGMYACVGAENFLPLHLKTFKNI